MRVRQRSPFAFWESLVYVWIVLYLGPLLAVAAIDAYGFRMLVPIIPFVLLIACRYLGPLLRTQPERRGYCLNGASGPSNFTGDSKSHAVLSQLSVAPGTGSHGGSGISNRVASA